MRKGEDIAKDGFNTRWKPGQSGNPAGKPKGTEHSSTRLKRLLEAVGKMKNPLTKREEEFTGLEMMDAAIIARAMKGDVAAYREILDRLEGKVPAKTEVIGNMNLTGTAAAVGEQEAKALLSLLNRIAPAPAEK